MGLYAHDCDFYILICFANLEGEGTAYVNDLLLQVIYKMIYF